MSRAGAQRNNNNDDARSSSREDATKQKKKKKKILFGRNESKEEETEHSSSRPHQQQQRPYHQEQQAAFHSSQYQQQAQQQQQQQGRYTTQQAMGGPRAKSVSAEFRENQIAAPNHRQQVRSSIKTERRFISPSHNRTSNNNSSSLVSSSEQDILAKQQGRRISSAGSAITTSTNSTRPGTNRKDALAAEPRRNSSMSRRSTTSSGVSFSDQDILAKQQGRLSGSGPPPSPGSVALAIREDKRREKSQQRQPTSNVVSRGSSVSRHSDNRDVLAKQQGLQGRISGTESTTRPGAVAVAIREDNTTAKRLGRTAADSASAVRRNSSLYSISTHDSSTQFGAVAMAIREDSEAANQEGRTADTFAAATRRASNHTLDKSVDVSWEESLYALEAELRTKHSSGSLPPGTRPPGDAGPFPLDIQRRRSTASSGRMSALTRTSDVWVDPIDETEATQMSDTSMYIPNSNFGNPNDLGTNNPRRNSNSATSSTTASGQGSRYGMSGNLTNDVGNHHTPSASIGSWPGITRGSIEGRSDFEENVSIDSYDTTFEDNMQRPHVPHERPIYPALETGTIIPADDLTVQAFVPVVESVVEPTAVVPIMSEQEETKLQFRKYGRYALCAATVFLVVVVSITVPIFSGRFKSTTKVLITPEPSTTPSAPPSLSPSLAPSSKGFMDVIDAVKDITPWDIFLDPSSPQFKAAEFMANLDPFGIRPVSDAYFLRRYALVTFYYATNGDNWRLCGRDAPCNGLKENWLSDTNECNWQGIFCEENNMLKLMLGIGVTSELGHSGTIPEEIGFLTTLSTIILAESKQVSGGGIGGTIPSSFSRLRDLETIQLSKNSLRSPIHDEWLANATLLSVLWLLDNEFDGTINTKIASLPSLSSLKLNSNMFTGTIPSEFGSATSLNSLDLGKNNLTGSVPANLYNVGTLEFLYLDGNRLTGSITPNVGNLTQLNTYELQNNGFTEKLLLHNNNFVGAMPDEICNALVTDNLILGHITVLTADCDEDQPFVENPVENHHKTLACGQ
eukprot:scaffold35325_cov54-Attheya_sp.AAC.1